MNDLAPPLLSVDGLTKHFDAHRLLRRRAPIRAVDGVDLSLWPGQVLSVVGESGSGKSTLARCVLGLERPNGGTVLFDGIDVARARGEARRRVQRGMQPIFQDPYSSLDPRWTVARSVREALDAERVSDRATRDRAVSELLDRVGLPNRFANRRPRELSSGQRQRVCIAAALASRPRLLIADEPVTALDVSIQAQVLNLLHEIQRDLGLAILLVAHDLGVVAHVSDRVAVMYGGRIVEEGPSGTIYADARHPYTQALLAARPRLGRHSGPPRVVMKGEASGALPDVGCRFRPRCRYAYERCAVDQPVLTSLSPEHAAACHVLPSQSGEDGESKGGTVAGVTR